MGRNIATVSSQIAKLQTNCGQCARVRVRARVRVIRLSLGRAPAFPLGSSRAACGSFLLRVRPTVLECVLFV